MSTYLPGVVPWFDHVLACVMCGKRTYRPAESKRPCAWCRGKLSDDGKLFTETLDIA